MSFKSISIIIPVYNEENTIGKVLENVAAADSMGLEKEIVVIDDGSTDKSRVIVKIQKSKIEKKHKVSIKLLFRKKNKGKGAAVRAGIMKSTGDIVLIQDSDLEYNPEDYKDLLSPILAGNADVVYGSRFVTQRSRRVLYFWHYLGNKFLTTFSNMMTNLNLSDMETGYKVFRGKLIRNVAPYLKSKRFGFEPEVTARLSKFPRIRIYEVGISYTGRTYAEGKKIGWFDALNAIWVILRFNLFG